MARSIAQLAKDYPGIDPSGLAIGEANARTLYGLVVDAGIHAPPGLSATARVTRRIADNAGQPFFGFGLQFNRDDIARLALFVGQDHGEIGGRRFPEPGLLDLVMQRVDGQLGSKVTSCPDFRCQPGFRARNVASTAGCTPPTWVPFMSGFGGIPVVMSSNGAVYCKVSDSGTAAMFDRGPARRARAIRDYCRWGCGRLFVASARSTGELSCVATNAGPIRWPKPQARAAVPLPLRNFANRDHRGTRTLPASGCIRRQRRGRQSPRGGARCCALEP